jgi:hypothetical protein
LLLFVWEIFVVKILAYGKDACGAEPLIVDD